MKKIAGRGLRLFLLAVTVITLGLIYETFKDTPAPPETTGIAKINIAYSDKKIYLDVYTTRSLTCDEVIRILGVEPVPVKTRIYVPACSVIDDGLVQIIYTEAVET